MTADDAQALARRLTDPDAAPPDPAGEGAVALAWALKDVCYAAWSADPARAARAADALQALRGAGVPATQAQEIDGLAAWTAGIAHVIRGRMADAVRAFDAAAAALRAAGQPDPAAQTQVPKIMALSLLGQHAAAAACAEAAQRELLALGNGRAAARVSQNLGSLHLRRDDHPQAARHFREAAVLFARHGDDEHSVFADIGLAGALTAMGDFDEALRIHARARMRATRLGLELPLAQVDESVALLDLARGAWRDALAGLESARRRFEALGSPQNLAIAEKQLADAYLELHLLPEAWALFDAACAKFRALDLPDEQAWALAQRGRAELLLGEPAADPSFAAAAALFAAGGNAVGEAAVALARAELALARGDADAALAFAAQAQRGYLSARHVDGDARAAVIHGRALLLAGRRAEAGAVFDSALARARRLQQLPLQVRCLTGQGLVALAGGEPGPAAACFEAAIALFEEQRRALPGDEIRSAFLTDHLRPYEELLRLALAEGDAATVLWQLDRFRARALDDRLGDPVASPAGAAVADAMQPLRERLNWLYRHVQREQEEGAHPVALQAELRRTEHALLEQARRQRLADAAGPAADSDAGAAAAFSVGALQAALRPAEALVAYGVLDDELFACVVTAQQVLLVRRLAAWPAVLEALRSARFQLDTLRHGAAPVRRHLPVLAQRMQQRMVALHALVWAPLAAAVSGCERLLLVPHGPLGALPFAALDDGGACLGERCELALAPSARAALRGLQRPPRPAVRVLALGESSRLPHTALEAQAVAARFAQGTAWVGSQATLATLRTHAGSADVIHLACHAQFRSDNPRFSALHLVDMPLTVEQAEALTLGACTVVLSACETGVAEHDRGDERVGLVRAFLAAGAARVLASQWPVDDAVTAGLMAHFYAALAAGQRPAAALRVAQCATRAEHPHPYFWSSFTLFGGW